MCYLITIPDIDGKCHIVQANFQVDVNPVMSFESKRRQHDPAAIEVIVDNDCTDNHNMVPNVFGGVEEMQQL